MRESRSEKRGSDSGVGVGHLFPSVQRLMSVVGSPVTGRVWWTSPPETGDVGVLQTPPVHLEP